ncbi:hypothetical protein C9374_000828 [Naegleria lovaniensis]|uniref:Uncharacterized protein n=1 Tax=Naegleria lovaniensis TaxID=51637 RepID=A0AA88GX44_NAELO|nr:uncharacterized protein C9374_000828 [Naegleria lovaniensis]KAG2387978.1 hypothetical protein C9374_000828 [Naegleria lovaniensis]
MFNILRFGIANHHYKNAIEVRDSIRSMAPPITSKRNDALLNDWNIYLPYEMHYEKILLLIHGGGGYGGQQDGWQASSIAEHVYLEQFQEFSKHENVAISCSNRHTPLTHMLSVNYRLMGLEEHERKNSSHYASNLEDQIHDVLQAYLWLISENLHVNSQERSLPVFRPEQIVVMGDSFGAALAAWFLLKLASDPKQYPTIFHHSHFRML